MSARLGKPHYKLDQDRDQPRTPVFASALQKLRMKAGITQEQFAEECGIHSTYVSRLERGRQQPSLKLAIRVAEVLSYHLMRDVSLDEFRDKVAL